MTVILDFILGLYIAALAAIAVGAGLVYLPAGLIVGGILVAASCGPLLVSALRKPRPPVGERDR